MTYQETPYQKFTPVDSEGNLVGSVGGSSGGSDASAANQATQITRETQILNAIATLALQFPSAPIGDRLKVDVPLLSDPPTNTTLTQILAAIKAQINLAATIWINDSGLYYIRRELVAEGTGAITYAYTDPNGNAANPTGVLRPLATSDRNVITAFYDVLSPGTGYSVGDLLARVGVVDVNGTPPSLSVVWMNLSLGTILATAPVGASVEPSNENVGARQIGNWSVALSDVDAAKLLNLSNAIGTPITAAVMPFGGSGVLGWLSGMWLLVSRIPAQGVALAAAAMPVTLATDGVFAVFAQSILAKLTLVGDALKIDGSAVTQPVSATSLPLPNNAVSSTDFQGLVNVLNSILRTIARPLWVNPNNSNVNCNIANGTLSGVTIVSSVGTVNNITSLNSLNNQPIQNTLMYSCDRTTWVLNVRRQIT
ncbi:MAG: hypothetical protein HWQ38_37860 [Nostoc sp. NMS7]|uniref:hypothetical protein n=1 Tax=Nostoc sp. NMS7 TaxID=2815391 RepID=UPI0025DB9F04|nr:hypothetical protein [Nostoc sp. NMS7]MBN3951924.1 hypothetical protein [Nostoc sp. NMS7]